MNGLLCYAMCALWRRIRFERRVQPNECDRHLRLRAYLTQNWSTSPPTNSRGPTIEWQNDWRNQEKSEQKRSEEKRRADLRHKRITLGLHRCYHCSQSQALPLLRPAMHRFYYLWQITLILSQSQLWLIGAIDDSFTHLRSIFYTTIKS